MAWWLLFAPERYLCDGSTHLVAPGEAYVDSLQVAECVEGRRCGPKWDAAALAPALAARLVWMVFPSATPPRWNSALPDSGHRLESAPFPLQVQRR